MESKDKTLEERVKSLEGGNSFNEKFIKEVIDDHEKEWEDLHKRFERYESAIHQWEEIIRNYLWWMRVGFLALVVQVIIAIMAYYGI